MFTHFIPAIFLAITIKDKYSLEYEVCSKVKPNQWTKFRNWGSKSNEKNFEIMNKRNNAAESLTESYRWLYSQYTTL